MEEQQKNIDEVFRQSLGGYREAPPGAAWQDVARRLDEHEERRPQAGFFLRWPWVALSLLLIAGASWMVVGLNGNKQNTGGKLATTAADTRAIPTANKTLQINETGKQEPAPVTNARNVSHDSRQHTASRPVVQREQSETNAPDAQASIEEAANAQPVSMASPKSVVANIGTTVADMAMTREASAPPAQMSHKSGGAITTPPFSTTIIASPQAIDPSAAAVAKPLNLPSDVVEAAQAPTQTPENWNRPDAEYLSPLASIAAKVIMKTRPSTLVQPAAASAAIPAPIVYNTPKELRPVVRTTPVPQAQPSSEPQSVNPIPAAIVPQAQADIIQTVAQTTVEATQTPVAQDIHIWKEKELVSFKVMGGYEHGANAPVSGRWTLGAGLVWPLSEKFAVGAQPAFRYGKLNTTQVSDAVAYARSTLHVDSFQTLDASPSVRFSIDTIYNYVVKESFDSIVVLANSVGGNFWELELPLLLHYRPNNSWYIYGGPSLNFGGKLSYQGKGDMKVVTTTRQDSIAQSQPKSLESFNNYFGRSSLPSYNNYSASAEENKPDPVRIGYLIGVGYSWNRLSAELSMHQQLTGYKSIAVPLQSAFSSPYIRVSIGYLLFGQKSVSKGFAE